MTNGISFEYYSTFAPVSGAFLADEPNSSPLNAYKNIKPLGSIDRGYHIYTSKKNTINKPGSFTK